MIWLKSEDKPKLCECGAECTEVEYSDGVLAWHCPKCDIDFIERDGKTIVIS